MKNSLTLYIRLSNFYDLVIYHFCVQKLYLNICIIHQKTLFKYSYCTSQKYDDIFFSDIVRFKYLFLYCNTKRYIQI